MNPSEMSRDISAARFLARRFLRPYWKAILGAVVANVAVGSLMSLRPFVLAPALNAFFDFSQSPAHGIADLTLDNVGPTIVAISGVDPSDAIGLAMFSATGLIVVTLLVAVGGYFGF
ncbi:MAG: hypothetical protein LJE84_10160, partial [Gammaproteobacteria bacterium]|nr:hypothetical protein [Gammaproteobacteria bacterium]